MTSRGDPRAESVCSVRAHPTIAAVPELVDVAVIAVPGPRVLEIAEECGHAGVEGIVAAARRFARPFALGVTSPAQLGDPCRR